MSLKETLNDYDIQLNDNQIDLLLKYMGLVLEKNKVMNLTAITEEEMFHVKRQYLFSGSAKSKNILTCVRRLAPIASQARHLPAKGEASHCIFVLLCS